jgi:hypothetical protein
MNQNELSAFDEIMEKINEIQRESRVVEDSKKIIEAHEEPAVTPAPIVEEVEEPAAETVLPPSVDLETQTPSFTIDEAVFDEIKTDKKSIPEERGEKSVIRRLLDEEDSENEEGDEYTGHSYIYDDAPADIQEFEKQDESEEIYSDLKGIVGKMAVKSVFFFILGLFSAYLFTAGFIPVLFGGNVEGIAFDIAFLLVDVLCIFASFGIFAQGISKLLSARADTDTLLALSAVFILSVRIAEMVKPEFLPFSLNFEPFLVFGLYFNVLAKKKIAANIKNNFKMISAKSDKLTVSVPASCEADNDLILETGAGGDIMYAHKTRLVSGYIEHSYSDFNWDEKIYRFLFVCIVVVLLLAGVLAKVKGIGTALLFPAAALSIATPFFSRYHYALSIFKNGEKIRKNGGILTSAKSAKELEDSELVIIAEEDFLDEDSVLLQGVKAIGNIQIDDLITNIAALFERVGTPLKALFMKMVDDNSVSLPRVDDIYYHEGMGYSCLIHSKMFLVGNIKLMDQFNIEIPENLRNLKLKEGRFPVYVSYHKSAAGIFIASYEHNKHTEDAVRIAAEECVSVGIVSNDFLFESADLKRLYPDVDTDLFRFISPKTGEKCREYLAHKEKSPDLIASITGPKGIFSCLYGASKLLTSLKANLVIRIIYTIVAIALMLFIALAGYMSNTALHVLAFQFIWLIPVWLICTFCK